MFWSNDRFYDTDFVLRLSLLLIAQVTNGLVILSGLLYGTQKQVVDKEDLIKEVSSFCQVLFLVCPIETTWATKLQNFLVKLSMVHSTPKFQTHR